MDATTAKGDLVIGHDTRGDPGLAARVSDDRSSDNALGLSVELSNSRLKAKRSWTLGYCPAASLCPRLLL
jgi:hypothetical protein